MDDQDLIRDGIRRAVDHRGANALVAAYFDHDNGFAADTFDALAENDPARITADDLLAVTLLDVRVPPTAVRAWLGPQSDRISELLGSIDAQADLWDDDVAASIETAGELWRLLQEQNGIGWVTAGKLLARKRPRLIPIYDSVVKAWMGAPTRVWVPLREVLCEDAGIREEIEQLRPLGCTASLLRLLDVAIWMIGSNSGRARGVRGVDEPDGPPPADP